MGVDDSVCRKRKRTRTFRVCTNYNSHHPSIVSSTSWVVLLLSSLLLSTLCRVVSAGNGDNDREDDNRDDRDDPLHRIHNDNNTVENHATSLTDVMLCMGFALGWAVWMVSCTKSKHSSSVLSYRALHTAVLSDPSNANNKVGHKSNNNDNNDNNDDDYEDDDAAIVSSIEAYLRDGILVPGNVLDAQQMQPGYDNIPVYKAIIDYKVQDPDSGQILQIRKTVETSNLLQVGFANIQMLVLPQDPHSGVPQEEFREMEREARKSIEKTPSTGKYVSLFVGALLVVASVLGALHAAKSLPEEQQGLGWCVAGVGILLLWPLATGVYTMWNRIMEKVIKGPLQETSCVVGLSDHISHRHGRVLPESSLTSSARAMPGGDSIAILGAAAGTRQQQQRELSTRLETVGKSRIVLNRLRSCTAPEACSYYIHMPPSSDNSSVSSLSSRSVVENTSSTGGVAKSSGNSNNQGTTKPPADDKKQRTKTKTKRHKTVKPKGSGTSSSRGDTGLGIEMMLRPNPDLV